jgi:hypothetical protein
VFYIIQSGLLLFCVRKEMKAADRRAD